jgi:hypothetical protein
MPKIEPLRLRI